MKFLNCLVVVADGTIDRYQLLWHERSIALHEYRVWLGNRSADQFSLVRMDVDCNSGAESSDASVNQLDLTRCNH